MKIFHYTGVALLLLLAQNIFAQKTVQEDAPNFRLSHSVYAPLSLVYGGLGYDCRFRMSKLPVDFAASISGGRGSFNFLSEISTFTDIPVSATVLFGKGWNSFETGLTFIYKDELFIYSGDGYFPKLSDKYVSALLTAGYRLQAPQNGFFLKVYGGYGGGISNEIAEHYYPFYEIKKGSFKTNSFLRIALGYSF